MRGSGRSLTSPTLGLRANWRQFALLVLVNALVGSMVGLERTVVPLLAEAEFGLTSRTAALAFIATFGAVKAAANFAAGRLSDLRGRRRVLIAGWLAAVPVPFMVMAAPSWGWIVAANVLLGVNQGLAWSMTVLMKIDLVGPRRRGLAMGLNEAAGYLAVAGAAYLTGVIAGRYGLRPEPFYLGIAVAAVGLALSILLVRETTAHVALEAANGASGEPVARPADNEALGRPAIGGAGAVTGREVLVRSMWRDPALFNCSQAGLVNNLIDGLAWGLFPILFAGAGLSLERIGVLAAAYPASWGLLQIGTGGLSDRWGRKPLIAAGMALQGAALLALSVLEGYGAWLGLMLLLGLGTALAYPTLLAAVGDRADPSWRGSAIGAYRLWRDAGYVVGAIVAGLLADAFDIPVAIGAIGVLTLGSAWLVVWRMPETLAGRHR